MECFKVLNHLVPRSIPLGIVGQAIDSVARLAIRVDLLLHRHLNQYLNSSTVGSSFGYAVA